MRRRDVVDEGLVLSNPVPARATAPSASSPEIGSGDRAMRDPETQFREVEAGDASVVESELAAAAGE
jgi:hypothetical protein